MRHWRRQTTLLVTLLAAGCGEVVKHPPPPPPPPQGFSIGGTVSGLAGTGLTLKLNEGEPLAVSLNGAFSFPDKLGTDTAYTVTVVTQPRQPSGTFQVCTPANATGTMGTSDVIDVNVVCVTPPPGNYKVGGTVANLEGSGLMLKVNGAEELIVAPGTTAFTFPTALPNGSPYAVTVSQQPAGATCAVSGGTGSLLSADVTTVAVECLPNAMVLRVGPRRPVPAPPDAGVVPEESVQITLLEFRPNGADTVRVVPIPETHSVTFTNSFEGGLARSANGRLVSFGAYRAPPGTIELDSSGVGAARSAITVDAAGVATVAVDVPESTAFNDAPFRSAVTVDGSGFWMAGDGAVPPGGTLSSGGVWYASTAVGSAPVRVSASPNTPRWLGIFGEQLYMSSAPRSKEIPPPPPSPYVGISKVGTGLPTSAGWTTTRIAGTNNGSPPAEIATEAEGFAFVNTDDDPAMDVLYVANYAPPPAANANSINVQKYVLNPANHTWNHVASFVPKFTDTSVPSMAVHGVAAKRLADGTTFVYVTALNRLMSFRDDGSDNPAVQVVSASPSNLRFRGVALAPVTE